MLERLVTAVIELDQNGRACLMNSSAEQCLGVSRERFIGKRLDEVLMLPDAMLDSVDAVRADGKARYLRECRLAGGHYDCHITALGDGRMLLELHMMKWEQRRRQLQQREVQTGMLELLRRNLGHEIRNPLGGIRGAAQMMAAELQDPDMQSLARLVMRESDRIDDLTRRFGDPSIPEFRADAAALRQVMLNLLLNAHQSGASHISVRTRVEHGETLLQGESSSLVRIDFEDNGSGVPESIRALLFLPLVTGRRDGTGLGLALSQQIAAAHGGLLTYKPLENGSRFSLRLPLERVND
jgi:two-component system nitrogen regulation sensor histidine kinase GlnL